MKPTFELRAYDGFRDRERFVDDFYINELTIEEVERVLNKEFDNGKYKEVGEFEMVSSDDVWSRQSVEVSDCVVVLNKERYGIIWEDNKWVLEI